MPIGLRRRQRVRRQLASVHARVDFEHLLGRTVGDDAAAVEQDRALAHLPDEFVRMRRQHHDARSFDQRLHAVSCARRKTRIAGAEPLVEQQDFRIDRGRNGEA